MIVRDVNGSAHHVLVKIELAAFNIGFCSIDEAIDALWSGCIPTAVGSDIEPNLHGYAS
jgi:hypothetical protein